MFAFPRRAVGLMALSAVLVACSDHNPAATGEPPVTEPRVPVAAVLKCTAELGPRTVSCTSASATGASADLLVGGQNLYVKLRSTNVQISGGVLSADVTVQNLLARPMGTFDGVIPTAAGTRVFFSSGPTVTVGTGSASVQNPDGSATFTTAGQPFYQYDGIIAPGATSASRKWQFRVSPDATQFVFTVFVATTLPGENGYIRLDPQGRMIAPGGTLSLSAWTVDAVGNDTQPALSSYTWTSSDTTVAKVSPAGVITGVANGSAVITAADGVRSGTTTVQVGALDQTPPAITRFTISPRTANAGDSIGFVVGASDAGTGVRVMQVRLTSPSGSSSSFCNTYAPASGTTAAGNYTCKLRILPGAEGGTWKVESVQIVDHAGRAMLYTTDDLITKAYATTVTVTSTAPDATAPTITGFTLAPTAVTAGDSITATFNVADAGTGVASASATIYHAASNRSYACTATAPFTGTTASGTFKCRIGTSVGAANGTWTVTGVSVVDRTGNNIYIDTPGLTQRGFTSSVTISGGTDDRNRPTLASFSVSPSTVTRADSVTFTVGAADPESGVATVIAEFRSPLSPELLSCQSTAPVSGTRANGTFVCKAGFGAGAPAGTWTLYDVQIFDVVGNTRSYAAGDLNAFGYPVTLTVTP